MKEDEYSVTEVLNVYNWKNTSWNDRPAQYFFKSYENLNFTDGEQGMSDQNKKSFLIGKIILQLEKLHLWSLLKECVEQGAQLAVRSTFFIFHRIFDKKLSISSILTDAEECYFI